MRRRWIYPKGGDPYEVTADYSPEPIAPMIFGDLPGYQSEASGLWVEGRVQRREDLKRTQCRPWEGQAQEMKEAQRRVAYDNHKVERSLERAAQEAFHQLPPSKRDVLSRRK